LLYGAVSLADTPWRDVTERVARLPCCIVDGYHCCVVDIVFFSFLQDCGTYCL